MKKVLTIIFIFTCACLKSRAQVNFITTICGNDTAGYNGDGIPAIQAEVNNPEGICYDHLGNIYIADDGNSRVRKINLSTGIITTVAGTDSAGYSGDGGLATNAKLFIPVDVFADTSGNVYIADGENNRIRKITVSTGIIETVAGNGIPGSSGDGGPATNAQLFQPNGICLDKGGNLYIADLSNYKIRKVDAVTGVITTIAGTGTPGYTGDNEPAINAQFASPGQVYTDNFGNIFIADGDNNAIRKITSSTGIITTIAGNGTPGYSGNGGPAVNALLNTPYAIFIDIQNNIFITEYGNGVIRRIDGVTGIITLVAGNGTPGFSGDGGPAIDAQLIPEGVCIDDKGIMYIADYENNRIRMVYNTLGVASPRPSPKEREVWPNPATDVLHIDNGAGNVLYMYDMLGQVICQKVLSSDKETVNISTFPAGVYVARIVDATGGEINRKVVKE